MRLRQTLFFALLVLWSGKGFGEETSSRILEKAEAAYVAQDFEGAIRFYDDFLSRFSSDSKVSEAYYWKARAMLALNRFNEARDSFVKARDLSNNLSLKGEAQLGYADSLYYVGENEGALYEYEKLYQKPGSASHVSYLLYQMGMIWKARGNENKAKSFFQNIIYKYPESYEASLVKNMGTIAPEKDFYYVQIGVFQFMKNVEKLIPKIQDLGYPYQIDEIEKASKKTYRLKVGGFSKEEDARKALFAIQRVTQVKGHIIKE